MKIEYFLGIDFGHGETCVSRIPGYDGEDISRILLRKSSFVKDQKVMSAIYQDKDGEWNFVLGKEDFKKENLREGFKGPIAKLRKYDTEALEALKEFGKLIFKTILKNDTDLKYDENTGEANFVICIANPSEWRREDPKTPEEYLNFFKQECGIKPAILCINESDAAFYTKFSKKDSKYSSDDTVFVIDLGSSTIDFTTYNNSKCIADGCWGHNLGAHLIEDKILSYGLEDAQNKKNLKKAEEFRKQLGMKGNLDTALSLWARKSKEDFYTNHDDVFELYVRIKDLVPIKGAEASSEAFSVELEKEDFDNIISDYRNQLELAIKNAAEKLRNNVMASPKYVILSGGASRMDFVEELARTYFPDAIVDLDPTPEWVVSNGAAKYIQAQHGALEALREDILKIDYKAIYKDADFTATQKATQVLMPAVIEKITGATDIDGFEIAANLCEFFYNLNSQNAEYVKLFNETAKAILEEKISNSIKNVIKEVFKMEVDMSGISLDYDFAVMDWNPKFFMLSEPDGSKKIGEGLALIMSAIEKSSWRCNFTWDKKRSLSERQELANGCKEKLSVKNPFNITFNENDLNNAAAAIQRQTLEIAEKLFHDKELFRTSNYK